MFLNVSCIFGIIYVFEIILNIELKLKLKFNYLHNQLSSW